jgi:predicted XRE-type DNA-binding protein
MQDCVAKSRKPLRIKGKLSDNQVIEIRSLWPANKQRIIAEMFGICQPHVSDILHRRRRKYG